MQMQDYKRALYDFSAAIRFETRSTKGTDAKRLSDYYLYAGQSNQLLGQYEEALAHYDIAVAKWQGDYQRLYNRGLTYASLERFEEAKKDFSKAMELANLPHESYRIKFNLGITLRRLGDLDNSIEELRKACDL